MTLVQEKIAAETLAQPLGDTQATAHWPGPAPGSAPVIVPGYQILGELGRGGMGVVYKARQIAIDRTVALKMILAADVSEYHERFRAEAEAAARLQHPNIVQLYEFGTADGRPFFSLEFVEGGSLADRLKGVPQPIDESARLVAQCAFAMQYAHDRGVVHRDLKPANILLQSDIPKIADFGLAKRLDAAEQTATGVVLGTPSYMSPEQAAGHSRGVGPATDIYSLGAILYECLTGRPPFRGGNALETVLQVAQDPPAPPRQLRSEVPRDLETICLRCLAKEPGQRYPSAQALADDLQRFLDREPIAARPASAWEKLRIWAKRRPARAVGFAAMTILAIVIPAIGVKHTFDLRMALERIQTEHRNSQQQLVRRTVANGNRLTGEGDYLWSLPWFTEALRVEINPERIPAHRMRIASILQMCPKLLQVRPHETPLLDACFRGDGEVIATARDDGSVRLWNVQRDHEPPRVLREPQAGRRIQRGVGTPQRLSFSVDGRWLVAQFADGTFCFDVSSPDARVTRIASGSAPFVWNREGMLIVGDGQVVSTWSPESGKAVARIEKSGAGAIQALAKDASSDRIAIGSTDGSIQVWNTATWRLHREVAKLPDAVEFLRFSPDGHRLLAVCNTAARVIDAATGEFRALSLSHSQKITDVAFSPDGRILATASVDDTAKLWNAQTGELLADPLKHNSDVLRLAFSSDGRLLATCSDDATARVWDVQTGRAHAPPLPNGGSVNAVAFLPVGHALLTASEDGTLKLWSLAPPRESPGKSNPLMDLSKRTSSLDGRYEAVSADTGAFVGQPGEYRVFDTQTGQSQLPGFVHPGGALSVAFSGDGSRIVTGGNDRSARIWDWRIAKEASPPLRHGSRVGEAVYSGDSRLVATASDDNSARVWNAATGEAMTPPLWHNGTVQFVRFNPEGTLLLTASKNDLALVWDIATADEIAPVRKTEPWVIKAFGSRVPSGPWDLPADQRPVSELIALAEWLSGHRVDPTGGLVPLSDEDFRKIGSTLTRARLIPTPAPAAHSSVGP